MTTPHADKWASYASPKAVSANAREESAKQIVDAMAGVTPEEVVRHIVAYAKEDSVWLKRKLAHLIRAVGDELIGEYKYQGDLDCLGVGNNFKNLSLQELKDVYQTVLQKEQRQKLESIINNLQK